MNKNQMLVAAIENGTVIDHIPSEKTYQVAQLLKLAELGTPVTIGYNFPSKKLGKKGFIKVENKCGSRLFRPTWCSTSSTISRWWRRKPYAPPTRYAAS